MNKAKAHELAQRICALNNGCNLKEVMELDGHEASPARALMQMVLIALDVMDQDITALYKHYGRGVWLTNKDWYLSLYLYRSDATFKYSFHSIYLAMVDDTEIRTAA